MRQYKKHIIKAEDVNPLVVYLVDGKPVRVVCTDERGWKRGRVKLEEDNYGFHAIVKTFDGATIAVNLQCEDKDFYFVDAIGRATLTRVPEDWILNEAKKIQQKVNEVNESLELLHRVKMTMDDVQDLQFPKELEHERS